MRKIYDHRGSPADDGISITVLDEPGNGGACHRYAVDVDGSENGLDVYFQNGPIGEVGRNGVTQEVLLAIAADRLRSFQQGAYACRENAIALTKIDEALHWLHHRTRSRVLRGVEGTQKQ